MECQTVSHIENGVEVLRDKKKYNDIETANMDAFKINSDPNQLYELVSYNCGQCGYFHLGTGDKVNPNNKKRYGQ